MTCQWVILLDYFPLNIFPRPFKFIKSHQGGKLRSDFRFFRSRFFIENLIDFLSIFQGI